MLALLAGGLALSPGAQARAELVAIGMVTLLWGPTEDMVGLREGLAELGYRQNKHVALGVRFAEGDLARLDTIVRQLVRDGATILYASGWEALEAAQRAAPDTPIVFSARYTPVRSGAFDRRAGIAANVTGVVHRFPEVSPQALTVFRSLIPTLNRVLVPYDAGDVDARAPVEGLRAAASRLGIELVERAVRTRAEARQVVLGAHRPAVDGMLPVGGRLNIAGHAIEASLRHQLPILFARGWLAEYGGLAGYGPSWTRQGRRAARLVAEILRGAVPADLPVEMSEDMEFVVNLRTARGLGITVPSAALSRADRVIQ